MVFDENMLIPKEDMIVKKDVVYDVGRDDISLADRTGYWLGFYREKLSPFIDKFRDLIKKGDGKTDIRMKDIRGMLGWEEFKNKSDMALYSRLKDILLENGIKIKMHHWYGANLIMTFVSDESEIINGTEAGRLRRENTAKNAGFSSFVEYRRRLESYKNVHGVITENKGSNFYSAHMGRQVANELFPGCIINKRSIDRYSPGGYDWITSDGIKVKSIVAHLRHSVDDDGYERDYFQWGIYKNDKADIFLLTGWGNGNDLELMKGWIIDAKEIVNGRVFWDRASFLISTHKRSIDKYSKFEIDDDKLEIIRKKIRDEKQTNVICEYTDFVDYRIEIAEWYTVQFRTVNWEVKGEIEI